MAYLLGVHLSALWLQALGFEGQEAHADRVANAARVCGSPMLGEKLGENEIADDLGNGYYVVSVGPPGFGAILVAERSGQVGFGGAYGEPGSSWLLSEVGAGLYHLSQCVADRPQCLGLSATGGLALAACQGVGFGDQVWWLKGYPDATWYFGNDGVGQMSCVALDEDGSLALEPCSADQPRWHFTRTVQPAAGGGAAGGWSVVESDYQVSLSNCVDCEETLDIVFACIPGEDSLSVAVHSLNAEQALLSNVSKLEVRVAQEVYEYRFDGAYYEFIGYPIPELELSADDPLLQALTLGDEADFKLIDDQLNLSLTGMNAAMAQFRTLCGWSSP